MADPVSTALSLAQLIVPSVEPVIRRLIEERRERKQMEKGLEKEIHRLFSNMEALKDLLHDADKKQYQSASLRGWLMSLKEVVSDADDVLDEYATDLAILQMEGGSQLLNPDGWRVKYNTESYALLQYCEDDEDQRQTVVSSLSHVFTTSTGVATQNRLSFCCKEFVGKLQVFGPNSDCRPWTCLGRRDTLKKALYGEISAVTSRAQLQEKERWNRCLPFINCQSSMLLERGKSK